MIEDTEKTLEEMMRDAEQAEEPGEMAKQQVIHRGDEELPAPMIATELQSAGYVYIYDTKTGDRSLCNRNMLASQLKKKRPDGSNVFTTVRPKVTPRQGTYKCLLHSTDPNREHYDALGFATCPKANLNSLYQVGRHMKKRHKDEWAAIEQERLDREKREDREFQRQLIGKAAGTQAPPLYVSKKDKAKEE